jgi:hypothetical protein
MKQAAWPPAGLKQIEQQLVQLADAVRDGRDRSIDEQVWLTRFLIVRACGYLEQVVHQTLIGHLSVRSGGTAKSFAISYLERSRTPSRQNLLIIVGRLDQSLRDDLELLLDEQDRQLHGELALLVGRRHQIAHGMNEGLTPSRALELTQAARSIADWFILALDPTPAARKS